MLALLPADWRCNREIRINEKCIFHAQHKNPSDFETEFNNELKRMEGMLANFDFTGFIFLKITFPKTFSKPTLFIGATFKDEAEFAGVTFQEVASFEGCEFQKVARFDGAIFEKGVRFGGVKFQQGATFHRAVFKKDAQFNKATFKGKAEFSNATFQENAIFPKSIFQGKAVFTQAIFQGNADFTLTIFNEASFAGTIFHKEVYFINCAFVGTSGFIMTSFGPDCVVKFISEPLVGMPDFQQFWDGLDSDGRRELERYWGKDLEQLINIMNSGKISLRTVSFLHTDVQKIWFLNVEWFKRRVLGLLGLERIVIYDEKLLENVKELLSYEEVAHIYWELRRNYERHGRYAEAGDFFISEMEMRRLQIAPPPPRKGKGSKPTVWEIIHRTILSWGWWRRNLLSPLAIYKYLSLYGESYTLAGLWILGTIFLFTFLRTLLPPQLSPQGRPSPDILDNPLTRSILALFQLRGEETIDNIERIIGAILTGNLFIALRRRLERR
jgi:uncharacterized protein YjbI with pentapeptide repeats